MPDKKEYTVYQAQTLVTTFTVVASSKDEAISKVLNGKGEETDYINQTEYEAEEM